MLEASESAMPSRFETFKTILPWIVTAALFLWQAGGSWAKVSGLEQTLKENYVTKDDFKHVAEDVRDIKAFLLDRNRRGGDQ